MPIPKRAKIRTDLVDILAKNGELDTESVYAILADKYNLSNEERAQLRGDRSAFKNEVRWARQDLVDDGLILREGPSGIGYWAVSDAKEARGTIDEDLSEDRKHTEGHKKTVLVNRYERDQRARLLCLAEFGEECQVCHTKLRNKYGDITPSPMVQVHHLVPLSSIGESYQVDPAADLLPVCPNCHYVMHLRVPPFTPSEVRSMLAKANDSEN